MFINKRFMKQLLWGSRWTCSHCGCWNESGRWFCGQCDKIIDDTDLKGFVN